MKARRDLPESIIAVLKTASVVEISVAREVLYSIGAQAYRESDDLRVIFPDGEDDYLPFYIAPDKESNPDFSLFVDEGCFGDCMIRSHTELKHGIQMDAEYTLSGYSRPFDEMVDAQALMFIVCKAKDPEYAPDHGNFLGRGRTQSHLIEQHCKKLDELYK